ncbi:MAG: cytochrome c3 family protein, partial [Acetobacteraceae bacterium]|nr:cytochrome c3 family protein [Acetobacteraceae bacterium]
MAAIFTPAANVAARAALAGVALLAVAGLGWWFAWPRTDWMRNKEFTVDQPVPFSHEHHVAGLGIDCLMCHNTVLAGSQAGLP